MVDNSDNAQNLNWQLLGSGFIFLLFLYCFPFFLQESLNIRANLHAQHLFTEALKFDAVQYHLSMNVLGHFILIVLFYIFIIHITKTLNFVLDTGLKKLLFISILMSWLSVCFINVSFFPHSAYLPKWPDTTYYLIGVISLIFFSVYFYALIRARCIRSFIAVLIGLIAISAALHFNNRPLTPSAQAATNSGNVIIVGVDSLSPVAFDLMQSELPNMRALQDHAVTFEAAYTPLARTCPAWISILSGKLPIEHGAYFNLRELSLVEHQDLLSHDLQKKGYQTIFAIDERRFCNINEVFGFEHLIGPETGILDFLVQRYNDTPLANLLLQFEISRVFFAHSYMNVASHNNYNHQAIIKDISKTLDKNRPTFLAVHLLSGHYPYHIPKAIPSKFEDTSYLARQSSALQLVDAQIGNLTHMLKEYGLLENAMVIFLSDHGEAMVGAESAVIYKDKLPGKAVHGHGTNIVSTWQNSVMFSVSIYENGQSQLKPTRSKTPVSLLDVRKIANHYVQNGALLPINTLHGCLPVETGLRIFAAMDYEKINYESILAEGLPFYTVDGEGRMVLNENRLKELIETKDFGVWCGNKLTFRKASQPEQTHTLLRQGYELREIELDPQGLIALENHMDRYRNIVANLPSNTR